MLKKLPDHPIAQAFPMAETEDRERIKQSLAENGQLEEIITLDGMVLDGRNRQDLLIELGMKPNYVDWKDLPPVLTAHGPVAFVKARNFDRRHLTPSQKAAVAAELIPFFEAEAKERRDAQLKQNAPKAQSGANGAGDEHSQDNGHDPADENQAGSKGGGKGGKKSGKGKAAAQAAAAVGVGTRSVEKANKLRKKDPKKFADVKAGKTTVSKATKDANAAEKKAAELESAYKRIAAVCGRNFGAAAREGKVLKGSKKGDTREVLEYAKMSEADMKKVQSLLENGWKLERARKYKMTALTLKNSIADLGTRAISQGVAKEGSWTLEITIDEVPLEIIVRKAKEAKGGGEK